MRPITNYIKERIAFFENKLDTDIDNNTIYPTIVELQAVLSKIEELKTNK